MSEAPVPPPARRRVARTPAATTPKRKPTSKPKTKPKRRRLDPVKVWANTLRRYRPGLPSYVIAQLETLYGVPVWERRLDPTSELILTILTQNTADVNAEKAPRIQAALRRIREERGDHSLEFLGDIPALEARDWLTSIDGIGKKTASILLLFCFGTPLMPVDRHVERVSQRIGLIPAKATPDQAHDYFLALLEPDQMYAAHVLLIHHGREICHARNPEHARCPVRDRCRFVDRKAP
jgi:endonuclease-3